MSDYLTNLFVQAEDRDLVAEAVKQILRPAYARVNTETPMEESDTTLYVAPSIRGWVGVFDLLMETQDEALCEWAVRKLSGRLNTVAVSFLMHDGEFIRYWLGRSGRLVDRYHSDPEYFGPVATAELKRLQGRPSILAGLCGKPIAAFQLAQILRSPGWEKLAVEMLDEIYSHLEIPNLILGFNTVKEDGEAGWLEGWDGFRAISLGELLGAQLPETEDLR